MTLKQKHRDDELTPDLGQALMQPDETLALRAPDHAHLELRAGLIEQSAEALIQAIEAHIGADAR